MDTIAVINGIALREPAFRTLPDGASAFSRSISFARALPRVGRVVLLLSRPLPVPVPEGVTPVLRERWSAGDVFAEAARAAEGFKDICYFHGDCALLDAGLARRMHDNHRQYWADYTFADGFPYGLAPEFLTRETADRLRGMAGEAMVDRDSVFATVRKDINSFDIETEIADTDMRLLRVALCADTERNFRLLSQVVASGAGDATAVCATLSAHPAILRTLPAFFPVQVVERCPQSCSYCPYPVFAGDVEGRTGAMAVDAFASLVRKIADFAGDAVVDISLWGEPALHPAIFDIIAAALRVPGIDLVVETSGVGWPAGILGRLRAELDRAPTWIVSLDAATEAVYTALRGKGFAEAVRTAEELLALFPGRAHVQAVRMRENEEDLEAFWRTWKARTENVIVQKYDSCAGLLADRAVADLSPVQRFPCWHLKRDMPILIDGRVPMCREDVQVASLLGNAFEEDLAVIWDRGRAAYEAHLAGRLPALCQRCDEYYTFNY